MPKKFLRQDTSLFSKLGRGRKKIQKWRKPKGRHSKMRKKRKSYPASPSVGYKKSKKESGKIKNLTPILINSMQDLKKATKNNILIISSKIGARKKLEIIKKSEEENLKILNLGGKK